MRIIGTSGHVDHGKSSLIQALSQINPMHLPAEKERGMTIDLGFAYLEDPQGLPIGIVDVPGHEKFIRNMVAGIWALDCVLLVVALDDGVMPMTRMHLKIAQAMGVKKLILVVNKIDLFSPAEREERLIQIRNDLKGQIPTQTPIVMVSSTTKEGIEPLKSLIFETLESIESQDMVSPQYYIDRVFDIKGTGQVVTGSLVSGSLEQNQNIWLYPMAKSVIVKTLQAYHQKQELVFPKSRVSLTLKNAPDLKRGMMLSQQNPQEVIFGCYFVVQIQEAFEKLKNYSEVEVSLGTGSSLAIMSEIAEGFLFLEIREPLSCLPLQPILLISHGGSTLLAHTQGLIGLGDKKQKNWIKKQIQLLIQKQITITPLLLSCLLDGGISRVQRISDDLATLGETLGEFFVLNWKLDEIKTQVLIAVDQTKGVKLTELSSRLQIHPEPLMEILQYFVKVQVISEYEQGYYAYGFSADNVNTNTQNFKLNLGEKNALAFAKTQGQKTFKAQDVLGAKASVKDVKNLVALGQIVFLEEDMYMSMDAYEKLESQILQDLEIGDRFSIQWIKEHIGLSRKYSIPILNMMEKRGFVRRIENERIVIKK